MLQSKTNIRLRLAKPEPNQRQKSKKKLILTNESDKIRINWLWMWKFCFLCFYFLIRRVLDILRISWSLTTQLGLCSVCFVKKLYLTIFTSEISLDTMERLYCPITLQQV